MGTPRTAARQRLDELLADGCWHDREQLVTTLMPLIPPGRAVRTAIRARTTRTRRTGQHDTPDPNPSRAGDDQTVGARMCAGDVIATTVRYGITERRTINGRPQIRLTPSQPTTNKGTP